MLDALERYFPEDTTWTKPDGGMFIWVTLPEYINTDDMMKEALDRKVAYVPSSAFYANEPKFNQMRLSFVTVPPEKIDQGVKVLAELVKEKMAAHKRLIRVEQCDVNRSFGTCFVMHQTKAAGKSGRDRQLTDFFLLVCNRRLSSNSAER